MSSEDTHIDDDASFDDGPPRAQTPDQQLSLFVNLEGFEGPIDLLLSLARDQKVDLTKIAILPLAEQYLSYISTAKDLNLEVAADYLVMAAWLAYLKSRLLLPEIEAEDEDEIIDMTDALRYQLLRLEAMQTASKRLMSLPRLGRATFARGMPEYFTKSENPLWTASLYDLLAVYGDMRSVEGAQTLTIAATRLYSVQEAAGRLRHLLKTSPGWTVLEQFLPPGLKQPLDKRSAIASHFVASLELAKEGVVNLRQQNHYGPIYLRLKDLS
ncbi:MAG: segregation and condensation protein A [Candidatus Puniceispirillaceae bacterium]